MQEPQRHHRRTAVRWSSGRNSSTPLAGTPGTPPRPQSWTSAIQLSLASAHVPLSSSTSTNSVSSPRRRGSRDAPSLLPSLPFYLTDPLSPLPPQLQSRQLLLLPGLPYRLSAPPAVETLLPPSRHFLTASHSIQPQLQCSTLARPTHRAFLAAIKATFYFSCFLQFGAQRSFIFSSLLHYICCVSLFLL